MTHHEIIPHHNGKKHPHLNLSSSTPLSSLTPTLLQHLSLPSSTTLRLIHKGRTLPQDETPLSNLPSPLSLYIISTSSETLSDIRSQKPDPLLRPFNPPTPKYVATPRRTRRGPIEYGFGAIEELPGHADSSRARKILEELSQDAGVLRVMELKKWKVGVLKEMRPEGKVGVDPVCVLGLNKNKGQEILLRLRTDDWKGFRARLSIRHVLCHELAHNEVSEHNDEFKELMRWIEKEVKKYDWKGRGERVGEGVYEGEEVRSEGNVGGRLGGRGGESRLLKMENMMVGNGTETWDRGGADGMEVDIGGEERKEEQVMGAEDVVTEEHKSQEGSDGIVLPESVSTKPAEENVVTKPAVMDEEPKSPSIEPNSAPSESRPTQPASTSEEQKPRKVSTAVSELESLGFRAELAAVALRETNRDVQRAADWILSFEISQMEQGEVEEAEREIVDRIQSAIEGMRRHMGGERLISALDTLHVYLGNLVRYPNVEKFTRINAQNKGFKEKVGKTPAEDVLKCVGFFCRDGVWEWTGGRVERVWYAKRIVVEELVRLLLV